METSGPYSRADPAGRFSTRPPHADSEDSNSSLAHLASAFGGHVDFEELENDPSERIPGGVVAERLWAASPQVRQLKWAFPALVYLLSLLLQSLSLYYETLSYVKWTDSLSGLSAAASAGQGDDSLKPSMSAAGQEIARASFDLVRGQSLQRTTGIGVQAAKLLEPHENFAELLGKGLTAKPQISTLSMDIVAGLLPYVWLAVVIGTRNLRIWTRTLLAASILALLRTTIAFFSEVPNTFGWEDCQDGLSSWVLEHYLALNQGLAPKLPGAGVVISLWFEDIFCGMRFQRNFVCTSSFSGSSFLCSLVCFALFDISRTWTRRMKPHFRSICQIGSAITMSSVAIADATVNILCGVQYSTDAVLVLLLSALLYQSPFLATLTDRLMLSGLKEPIPVTPLGASGSDRQDLDYYSEDRSEHTDVGDVLIAPCCFPFCMFHGRYFLFTKPAQVQAEALRVQQQAEAELAFIHQAQEHATMRILELEAKMQSLRQRQERREREEPQYFERKLEEQLALGKAAFQRVQQQALIVTKTDKTLEEDEPNAAEKQTSGLQEAISLEVNAVGHVAVKKDLMAGDFRSLPTSAWSAVYRRFSSQTKPEAAHPAEKQSDLLSHTCSLQPARENTPMIGGTVVEVGHIPPLLGSRGDFRTLPFDAWDRLHKHFAHTDALSISGTKASQQAVGHVAVKKDLMAGDFRSLPTSAWSAVYRRFSSQTKPEVGRIPPLLGSPGDFRTLPFDAWDRLHKHFAHTDALSVSGTTASQQVFVCGDFRSLPPASWSLIHKRFPKACDTICPSEALKVSTASENEAYFQTLQLAGSFRTLPPACWALIHARFCETDRSPKPGSALADEVSSQTSQMSLQRWNLRPSAAPSIWNHLAKTVRGHS